MNLAAINGTVKTGEQNTLTVKPDGGDNPPKSPLSGGLQEVLVTVCFVNFSDCFSQI